MIATILYSSGWRWMYCVSVWVFFVDMYALCVRLYNEWYTEWVRAMKRVLLIFVVVVAIAVAATAAAVSTAIVVVVVRHVFPKRSIFTWYSMPLALTFFLSFFLPHFFPLLCPFFLTVGAFFFYSILFSLIPFYSIELIQTPTCNSKWIVYVFVWISSHKWRATCDLLSLNLYICCVGVCVIEQHNIDFRYTHTHKHETRIHACTYDILATIYAEKEVKIII